LSITPYGIIPEHLLDPAKKEEVILFLAKLPGPARRRKEIYVGWCKLLGVAITQEDVEKVVGPFWLWTQG